MRTSSAQQLEFPGFTTLTAEETGQSDFVVARQSGSGTVTTFTPLSAPSPNVYGSAYAATSRLLARLNTSIVKKEEIEGLLQERQALLDKKFNGTMSRYDENRLEYVRWSLGRIQDVRSGPSLDALENIVEGYERLLSGMSDFQRQLDSAVKVDKRRR
jgi:hypothetical protein